eukprot:672530-Pelagomonas_calceolata.AAC.4
MVVIEAGQFVQLAAGGVLAKHCLARSNRCKVSRANDLQFKCRTASYGLRIYTGGPSTRLFG